MTKSDTASEKGNETPENASSTSTPTPPATGSTKKSTKVRLLKSVPIGSINYGAKAEVKVTEAVAENLIKTGVAEKIK